jgi:hypothetical protein
MVDQDSTTDHMITHTDPAAVAVGYAPAPPAAPVPPEAPPPAHTANAIDAFRWLAMASASAGVPENVEVTNRTRTMHIRVSPDDFAAWQTLVGAVAHPAAKTDVLGTVVSAESVVPGRWELLLTTHIRAGEA